MPTPIPPADRLQGTLDMLILRTLTTPGRRQQFGRLKAALGKEIDAEGVTVAPLHAVLARGSRTTLLVLMGAVVCVLLIACVNPASANLARGEARQRELALVALLGAWVPARRATRVDLMIAIHAE